MDIDTRTKLLAMVRRLIALPCSTYFREPVDPVLDEVPTYFDVVHQPMDLGTVEKRLMANSYGSTSDVIADLRLIVSNAKLFNSPKLAVYKEACMLSSVVEKWVGECLAPEPPPRKRRDKRVTSEKTLLARIKVLEDYVATVDEDWDAADREFGDLSEKHAATVAAKDLEIERLTKEVETLRTQRPLSLTDYIDANYKTLKRRHKEFKRGEGPCLDDEKLGEYIIMKAVRKAKKAADE